jgi:hypothetical protein
MKNGLGWYMVVVAALMGLDGIGLYASSPWRAVAQLSISIALVVGGLVLIRRSKTAP